MDTPDVDKLSWLSCYSCGHRAPLLQERRFKCPTCGGIYEVKHSYEIAMQLGPERLKRVFDRRAIPSQEVEHRSGVWRFREAIMPCVPTDRIVTLGEGVLPIQPAGKNLRGWIGGELDLWILPEGLTTTGSFKDFGGTVAVSVAKMAGVQTLISASTGDTSAMMCAYGAAAGMSCVVILPKNLVTTAQLAQVLMHGGRIINLPGSFDDCMRVVRELSESGRAFPLNSINPTRIEGHQASVFLIAQFLGWQMPDAIVAPIGNGSNTSSIGKGMRLLNHLGFVSRTSRIIGVQSEAANPLACAWEETKRFGRVTRNRWLKSFRPQTSLGDTVATAMRIGAPVSYEKVITEIAESNGAVLTALERNAIYAVRVAGRDGFEICPQTGVALAGLRSAVVRGLIGPKSQVFVVSTATGLKFPEVGGQDGTHLITDSPSCETERVAELLGV